MIVIELREDSHRQEYILHPLLKLRCADSEIPLLGDKKLTASARLTQ